LIFIERPYFPFFFLIFGFVCKSLKSEFFTINIRFSNNYKNMSFVFGNVEIFIIKKRQSEEIICCSHVIQIYRADVFVSLRISFLELIRLGKNWSCIHSRFTRESHQIYENRVLAFFYVNNFLAQDFSFGNAKNTRNSHQRRIASS